MTTTPTRPVPVVDDEEFFMVRCRCGAVLAAKGANSFTRSDAKSDGWTINDNGTTKCPKCQAPGKGDGK